MKSTSFTDMMKGKTVLLTGGGGGIGYETARVFASMGARIIIAEIQKAKGKDAEDNIIKDFPENPTLFYEIDLSDENQVLKMAEWIKKHYGVPDVIFNNATITKMGTVDEVDMTFWDKSYAVNFKAPLLLTQLFLPEMKKRKSGTLVFVSSSGAAPYMGAYEVFKTAQVELSNTLAMELEDTGVYAYTIGPGLVKTETAIKGIEIIAKNMGISQDEFYKMNNQHILDVEKAGLGFALSAAFSSRYHGQEIGCVQVLTDFDYLVNGKDGPIFSVEISKEDQKECERMFESIQETFQQQYAGWKKMNIFERQWVLRDFKKKMGIPAEQAYDFLRQVHLKLKQYQALDSRDYMFFSKLEQYWEHQLKLLRGYEKDKKKLKENEIIIKNWIKDIRKFLERWS